MTEAPVMMARRALRAAVETRRALEIANEVPICIYDVAERLGVEVRFLDGASFEGMFEKNNPVILVPSERPAGRQAFACAHELGHWRFGHGTRLDMSMADTSAQSDVGNEQERLVDLFAGFLLMPPWAVKAAFANRGHAPATAAAEDIYAVGNQLGVGYGTLLWQMYASLGMLPRTRYGLLVKDSPKEIRHRILGEACPGHLLVVDRAWAHVAIDVQVGDLVILPRGSRVERVAVSIEGEHSRGLLARALRPGLGRVEVPDGSWASYLRISRRKYIGLACFRHLEDPDLEPTG